MVQDRANRVTFELRHAINKPVSVQSDRVAKMSQPSMPEFSFSLNSECMDRSRCMDQLVKGQQLDLWRLINQLSLQLARLLFLMCEFLEPAEDEENLAVEGVVD